MGASNPIVKQPVVHQAFGRRDLNLDLAPFWPGRRERSLVLLLAFTGVSNFEWNRFTLVKGMTVTNEAKVELKIVWILRPQPSHRKAKAKDKHSEDGKAFHVRPKR